MCFSVLLSCICGAENHGAGLTWMSLCCGKLAKRKIMQRQSSRSRSASTNEGYLKHRVDMAREAREEKAKKKKSTKGKPRESGLIACQFPLLFAYGSVEDSCQGQQEKVSSVSTHTARE